MIGTREVFLVPWFGGGGNAMDLFNSVLLVVIALLWGLVGVIILTDTSKDVNK